VNCTTGKNPVGSTKLAVKIFFWHLESRLGRDSQVSDRVPGETRTTWRA
jgi:hypothetical protein